MKYEKELNNWAKQMQTSPPKTHSSNWFWSERPYLVQISKPLPPMRPCLIELTKQHLGPKYKKI